MTVASQTAMMLCSKNGTDQASNANVCLSCLILKILAHMGCTLEDQCFSYIVLGRHERHCWFYGLAPVMYIVVDFESYILTLLLQSVNKANIE